MKNLKNKLFTISLMIISILLLLNCENSTESEDKKYPEDYKAIEDRNDDAVIIIAEDKLIEETKSYSSKINTKWNEITHTNIAYICAVKLGLSEDRAGIIRDASEMPDVFQSGIENGYNQQWSHAYMLNNLGWWNWGDADDDFHDNIDGDSGEWESPEGYNGKWAGYYYNSGNRDLGDWYTGYAVHFIEDTSLVLHSSFPIPQTDILTHHFDFENWVSNNWDSGHMFKNVVEELSTSSYYTITDLKKAIKNSAKGSNYYKNSNAKNAWKNYKSCGYPTAVGTGNSDCVYYTKKMIEEATKWAGATIKYSLDKYNQW